MGLFTMDQPPPHDGERHPDGDEILIVLAGTLRICCDSEQHPVPVRAGEACIVRSGEWHKLEADEPCTVIHITPGPDGEARFRSA
ncbi:MAG: cupin domain-containing protein [Pseudomonadales bacterium]|nr:cupin domain-containing protein [Pseudomonadales bacterium]